MIYCKKCGRDITKETTLPCDGGDICLTCNDEMYRVSIVDTVNIPQDVVFKGHVAKLGRGRKMFEVPKKQRDFISYNEDYIIVIKKLKGAVSK